MNNKRQAHIAIFLIASIATVCNADQTNRRPQAGESEGTQSAEKLHYCNTRFNFCLEFPKSAFTALGESENGDGQVFQSIDGMTEIRAYGSWLMEPEIHCSASEVFKSDKPVVTLNRSEGSTSVQSGFLGERIFYVKTVRMVDRCLNLTFTYPKTEKEKTDKYVSQISASFGG